MDAWVLDESPGRYRWGAVADPEVGRDDVAVRPVASALNHMDLWLTKGQPKPRLPHVPGCDVAGVVEAVGDDVTTVAVGDEVVLNPAVSPIEAVRSEEHTSELQSLMRISYAVFCLKKKKQ